MQYNITIMNTMFSANYYISKMNKIIRITPDYIKSILEKNWSESIKNINIDELTNNIYNLSTDEMTVDEIYYLISDHCAG